jgi:hypothetical protein
MTIRNRGRAGAGVARSIARRIAGSPQRDGVANHFPLWHYYSPVPTSGYSGRSLAGLRCGRPSPARRRGSTGVTSPNLALCRSVFAVQKRLGFADDQSADPTVCFTSNDRYPPFERGSWKVEGILRHLARLRVIEIWAGFSSLVTARVNREYLNGAMAFGVRSADTQPDESSPNLVL